ncbi:hypothetical protein VTO42DRAFT_69 [Malbranchea cinnamomea]
MSTKPPPARSPHLSATKSGATTSIGSKTSPHFPPSHLYPEVSRSSSRAQQGVRRSGLTAQQDGTNGTSFKATTALIRRILVPQTATTGYGSDQNIARERVNPPPLEELLPPLTSSNEVDLQLYALIALVMKEFIHTWFLKITPDTTFTEELLQVIAHCTRAIEQRLRRVDIEGLILDEIPALIEAHVHAYRTAFRSPLAARSQTHFRAVYHTLNPHRALSPVPDTAAPATVSKQKENEAMYRQLLAQGILAVLLPTEDLENMCLRTLVGDILADLLLGEIVSDKLCEGWFIWETVIRLVTELQRENAGLDQKRQSEMFTTLASSEVEGQNNDNSSRGDQSRFSVWLWGVLQFCYLIILSIRFVARGLYRAATTPLPSITARSSVSTSNASSVKEWTEGNIVRVPVIKYRLFGMISQIMDIPRRMPWLGGSLALVQHLLLAGPGHLGETGGIIDRFLRETIQDHLLPPTLLPLLLLSIRTTLFPSNTRPVPASPRELQTPEPEGMVDSSSSRINLSSAELEGPSPQLAALQEVSSSGHPSESNKKAIKRACAVSIASLIPRQAALAVFAVPAPIGSKASSSATIPGESSSSSEGKSSPAKNQAHLIQLPTSSPPTSMNTPYKSGAKSEFGPQRDHEISGSGGDQHRVASQLTGGKGNSNSASSTSSLAQNHNQDGGEDSQWELVVSAIERDILDLFSDSYCNKHLMFAIVETVLVKIVPELAEHSVAELMNERGL